MRSPWTTLASRLVYENPWIRVREDRVVRPDGSEGIYGVVEVRPSVGILAINECDELALVGQWRYATNRHGWEIPRGGSVPGETDMLAVGKRELREETGIEARCWEPLGTVDVQNGVSTDVQHFFAATGLTLREATPDPEEKIALRWVPVPRAVEMALSGDIAECCSVAAILKYDALRRRR